MMRPRGKHQARQHMLHLMKRRLKGSRQKINKHYNQTLYMSDVLWTGFQVGAYQYQLKHLKWFLEEGTKFLLPSTRYRYWLAANSTKIYLPVFPLLSGLTQGPCN